MKLYELSNITHCYDQKVVLKFSNLCLFSGEMIGISGKNGSGKSTLLRLLAFLETPSYGEVKYYGSQRGEIAILLPDVCLLNRSVRANLEYMFKIRKNPIEESKIKEVLALVGLDPNAFLNRSHLELSSGERQRVGLAQRLLLKPRVLLLDEPTNSLDQEGLKAFSRAIWWANEELKTTIITISHDKKWLDQNSRRRLKLHFGALIPQNQANLFSHNWSKTHNNEKYYEFGNGEILFLPNSQNLDVREGIFITQEHILLSPREFKEQRLRHVGALDLKERSDEAGDEGVEYKLGSGKAVGERERFGGSEQGCEEWGEKQGMKGVEKGITERGEGEKSESDKSVVEKSSSERGGLEHPDIARLNAQIVGMRIDPLNPDLIALECKIGQEILRKSIPVSEAMDFRLFDAVEIGFDISGILEQNKA